MFAAFPLQLRNKIFLTKFIVSAFLVIINVYVKNQKAFVPFYCPLHAYLYLVGKIERK